MNYFYNQAQEVDKSVQDFVVSLGQAVAIVIVVLLFAMGLRSGVIIGLVLLLTVFGTFIMMKLNDVELHRISLGALDYCTWVCWWITPSWLSKGFWWA